MAFRKSSGDPLSVDEIISDTTLSLKEKAMYFTLSNYPTATLEDLKCLSKDGSSSITTAMRGLKEKNYIMRKTTRNYGKVIGVSTIFLRE